MSLESSCAAILRNAPSDRVSIRVDVITVDKTQMEKVAKAIDSGDIAVEVGNTGSQLGASYSSWKGRRLDPGEKKLIGKITVGSANVVNNVIGKAAVFHESVHALMDVADIKVIMHNDEVIAYLADAMYLKAMNMTSIGGDPLAKAIYAAAFKLIDDRKLLTMRGTKLTWSDCDALRDAIKAHPAYR
ncbi:hypothetical protein [Haloferula sp. BvORR071]|uniref:hypothetical protein n=1 Tax=Haloferula sp. BvORR071 TaxID=1396141 RepID=UPI00054E4E0C|nr:hypothetical protein [Haloferula sp. BvORR071]